MNEETVGRIGSMFAGLFLFFFGLPFTLAPFMILSDGVIDPDYPLESLFMIAFTIPFLMGGLLVQFLGLSMIRGGLSGTVEPTSIPRELPPSLVVPEEKGWWEGDDGSEEEYDGSISWKLNVSKLIQLLPFVATAIWIILEIL